MENLVAQPIKGIAVSLTPLRDDDADSMVSVLADPQLYRFTGGEAPTLEELTARYRFQLSGGSSDGSERWLNWIVRLDDRPVGFVQATVAQSGNQWQAELAWVIGTPWQGRGAAAEAAELMMRWLVERRVLRFTSSIHPEHRASQGVARKLGLILSAGLTDEGEQLWVSSQPC